MDSSIPSSTSTTSAVAPQALRAWKGTAVLDTVKVSPDTFTSVMFMSSVERREFVRDARPACDRPQKVSGSGVLLWSVQVAAVNWRGNSQLISITVPMNDDPASKFTTGQLVEFVGLVFGVTPKREGGFVTWCSADGITAA
jgi:hypothetical protein